MEVNPVWHWICVLMIPSIYDWDSSVQISSIQYHHASSNYCYRSASARTDASPFDAAAADDDDDDDDADAATAAVTAGAAVTTYTATAGHESYTGTAAAVTATHVAVTVAAADKDDDVNVAGLMFLQLTIASTTVLSLCPQLNACLQHQDNGSTVAPWQW